MARHKRKPGSIGLQLMRFGQDRIETYVPGGSSRSREGIVETVIRRLEAMPDEHSSDDLVVPFAPQNSWANDVNDAPIRPLSLAQPDLPAAPQPTQQPPIQRRVAAPRPNTPAQPVRRVPHDTTLTDRKTPPDLWAILQAHDPQKISAPTDTASDAPAPNPPPVQHQDKTPPVQRQADSSRPSAPTQPKRPAPPAAQSVPESQEPTPPDLWAILDAHEQNSSPMSNPSVQKKSTPPQPRPLPPRRRAKIQEITPKQQREGKEPSISDLAQSSEPDVVSRQPAATLPTSAKHDVPSPTEQIQEAAQSADEPIAQRKSDTPLLPAHVERDMPEPVADTSETSAHPPQVEAPSLPESTSQADMSRREPPSHKPIAPVPVDDRITDGQPDEPSPRSTPASTPNPSTPTAQSIQRQTAISDNMGAAPNDAPDTNATDDFETTSDTPHQQRSTSDTLDTVIANMSDEAELEYDLPTFDPEEDAQTEQVTYTDHQPVRRMSNSPFSAFTAPNQLPQHASVVSSNNMSDSIVQPKSIEPEVEAIVRQNMAVAAQDDLSWQWDEVHIADTQPTTPVQSVEPRTPSAPPSHQAEADSNSASSSEPEPTAAPSGLIARQADPDSAEADLLRLLDLPPNTPIASLPTTPPAAPQNPVVQRQPVAHESDESDGLSAMPYQTVPLDVALMGNTSPTMQRAVVGNPALPPITSPETDDSDTDTDIDIDIDDVEANQDDAEDVDVEQLAKDVFKKLRHRLRLEQERRSQQ